jgi:hypothetical protein
MSSPMNGKRPPPSRGAIDVAAAVAREAVVQFHVDHARELMRLAEGRIAPLRALDIYVRLLELTGTTGEMVMNRTLATLGRDASVGGATGQSHAAAEAEEAARSSTWRLLRRRLRGRVHDDLRRAVELHRGAVEKALLELHVTHAHGFVGLHGDEARIDETCQLYVEMVGVPPRLEAVLYPFVLARLAADELPRRLVLSPAASLPSLQPAAQPPAQPGAQPAQHTQRSRVSTVA